MIQYVHKIPASKAVVFISTIWPKAGLKGINYHQLTSFIDHLIAYVHQLLSNLKYFAWYFRSIQNYILPILQFKLPIAGYEQCFTYLGLHEILVSWLTTWSINDWLR